MMWLAGGGRKRSGGAIRRLGGMVSLSVRAIVFAVTESWPIGLVSIFNLYSFLKSCHVTPTFLRTPFGPPVIKAHEVAGVFGHLLSQLVC